MMNYPFLDFDKLENSYSESLGILEQSFNKILVVGIGGSSQGSKAINPVSYTHLTLPTISRV